MSEEIKNLVKGIGGGTHVTGAPLTTDLVEAASPGLLQNSIDKAIVKIRPMATPLDQISRLGHVRKVETIEVDYYSVDTRPGSDDISERIGSEELDDGMTLVTLKMESNQIFEPSETFLYWHNNDFETGYVVEKGDGALIKVIVPTSSETTLESGSSLFRMGRAATQLDVQSPQFSVLPKRKSNVCQIFKMQIEQSTMVKMSHKEIGWDFTDQQEAAIFDMRMGMEKQFLFGKRMKFYDFNKKETVTTTEGIWHQAGRDASISLSNIGNKELVNLMRQIFSDGYGSRRKILLAGSELISALNKVNYDKVVMAQEQVTSWGIDFTEIVSKFGRLYVLYSEVLDSTEHYTDGIVVDPEYIQKHVFIPFTAEKLDLRGSGQRNTEAMVLTEASCLTLRYPEAHLRVYGV